MIARGYELLSAFAPKRKKEASASAPRAKARGPYVSGRAVKKVGLPSRRPARTAAPAKKVPGARWREREPLALPPLPVAGESYPGDLARLDSLVRAAGLQGLREKDALIQLPLEPEGLTALALRLEEGGRVRILSFRPLFLLATDGIDFLGGKLISYIEAFHKTHPKEAGVPFERLARRFDVPEAVLRLALKSRVHRGDLKEDGPAFARADFQRTLPPREEKALDELEAMCFSGDFRTVSLHEISERLRLSGPRLEAMLDRLIERRRVVRGKEGFYLHARWLDDLKARLRALGKREIAIAEFKALTGLSRKYAIPLLELLDEMGVTRRRGSIREILE